jgi:short subunit dehydrogenase-like uncharacterized protein
VKRALAARVRRRPAGPTADERARRSSHLWAEARDAAGRIAVARLRTPESYELTSMTALDLATRALRGEVAAGFQTPARACGPDYVLSFPGVAREDVAG